MFPIEDIIETAVELEPDLAAHQGPDGIVVSGRGIHVTALTLREAWFQALNAAMKREEWRQRSGRQGRNHPAC